MADPVIVAEDVGIEFLRVMRHRISLRELVFKQRSSTPTDRFWGLRHINFTIQPGEAVGLCGGNGSGKSTLLKLIAGSMIPDEGQITVTQGVSPLIELTGGFLGDLSARENVYLTAGLHGLTTEQIDERFDDIISFAGNQVRDSLETPFRHFSSGMQVRLGFAVMTSLDEPIILVDEVLAVGDRGFQEKCHRRMAERLAEGKTLFLVSHSESDLRRFCTRGLYLRNGELIEDGPMDEALAHYNADLNAS